MEVHGDVCAISVSDSGAVQAVRVEGGGSISTRSDRPETLRDQAVIERLEWRVADLKTLHEAQMEAARAEAVAKNVVELVYEGKLSPKATNKKKEKRAQKKEERAQKKGGKAQKKEIKSNPGEAEVMQPRNVKEQVRAALDGLGVRPPLASIFIAQEISKAAPDLTGLVSEGQVKEALKGSLLSAWTRRCRSCGSCARSSPRSRSTCSTARRCCSSTTRASATRRRCASR